MTERTTITNKTMKLREQIKSCVDNDQLEKIADEHAIGFAEWLYHWANTRLKNGNWIIGLGLKAYTSEEVLLKYKKEKGL